MAMQHKHTAAIVGGVAVVGVIVAWLLARSGAGSVVSPAPAAGQLPLSSGDWPNSYYNLNFMAPGAGGPATGYAPLFGFIGWGTQWF